MELSDCEHCWDTPCTCGHEGYYLVYKRNYPSWFTKYDLDIAILDYINEHSKEHDANT